MLNIPNVLTTLRFIMIGVFLYFFFGPASYISACVVYCLAAVTDVLDGYIARKYDMVTDIGKLLDPLADKLMLIAALVCFYTHQMIPSLILLFVVIKEALMIAGGWFLYNKKVVVYANWVGKLGAFAFNAAVFLTFFADYVAPWNLYLFYFAMAVAAVALVQYGVRNLIKGYLSKEDE